MAISDPIANFLTLLRNALMAKHRFVDAPWSRMNENLAKILEEEGFVKGFKMQKDGTIGIVRIYLKYDARRIPLMHELKRISKPGRRHYVKNDQIPNILGGMGICILSTSKGVMTGNKAKSEKLGGELLCSIS